MTRMTGPECAVMFNLINAQTHTHITNTYTPRVIPINSGSCCFCCCCYYLLPHVQRSQQQTECKSHAPISLTNHKQTSWCHLLLRVTPAYIRRKDTPPRSTYICLKTRSFGTRSSLHHRVTSVLSVVFHPVLAGERRFELTCRVGSAGGADKRGKKTNNRIRIEAKIKPTRWDCHLFVALSFEWFNCLSQCRSRVLFNTFIKELVRKSNTREKERKRERENGAESIYLQEFGVITPTHVST